MKNGLQDHNLDLQYYMDLKVVGNSGSRVLRRQKQQNDVKSLNMNIIGGKRMGYAALLENGTCIDYSILVGTYEV